MLVFYTGSYTDDKICVPCNHSSLQFKLRVFSGEIILHLENMFRKAGKRNASSCVKIHIQFCIVWLNFLSSYLFEKMHTKEYRMSHFFANRKHLLSSFSSLYTGQFLPLLSPLFYACCPLLYSHLLQGPSLFHLYSLSPPPPPASIFIRTPVSDYFFLWYRFLASLPDFPLHPELPCIQPFSLSCSRKSSSKFQA